MHESDPDHLVTKHPHSRQKKPEKKIELHMVGLVMCSTHYQTNHVIDHDLIDNATFNKIIQIKKNVKEIFLSSGHDQVVTIISRNFSIAKVWCCMGLY